MKMKDPIWGLFFDENTGEVCIDILDREWSPAITITKILQALISLLSETKINFEESTFLNPPAAILKQNNETQFNEEVRKFCEKNHYKKRQIYPDVYRGRLRFKQKAMPLIQYYKHKKKNRLSRKGK